MRQEKTTERRGWTDAQLVTLIAAPNTNGCELWTGRRDAKGYGVFKRKGKPVFAYRWNYERVVGPIPRGLVIDHLCRVPSCVAPAHLEPVTSRENILRGESFAAVNAAKTACAQGHPYDFRNTYQRPSGARDCRACGRERQAKCRMRKSA